MKRFLLFGKTVEQKQSPEQDAREKEVLKSLRKEVGGRIRLAEKKESQLLLLHKKVVERENALRAEEERILKMKKDEESLRTNIPILQRVYDDKKSGIEERQKAILLLTREMNALLQKRADIRRAEVQLKQTYDVDRKLREQVAKTESRVAEGASIISKQEEDMGKYSRLLKDLRSQIDQALPIKKQIDVELGERQKTVLKVREALSEMERELKTVLKTKADIQKRNALVTQREGQLAATENKLQDMKKEIASMSAEAESVQKNKQELFALIEDKKHLIEEMKKNIFENHDKISEAHAREVNARKAEHDLLSVQHENDKKLKLLESTSQEMTRREAAFLDHERALKDAARVLAKDKKEFADEVNSRKAELLLVQQEWEKKLGSLSEEKTYLKREKEDVRRLVETDVIGLKEKEDELIEAIAMMERDKDKLLTEEKSLLRRVSELEKEKSAVEKVVKELASKEKCVVDGERLISKSMKFMDDEKKKVERAKDEVYRARELRKTLPLMERRYSELRKNIAKTEARMIGKGVEPSAVKVFKQREKELSVRERGVELEVRKLMQNEGEVEKLEQRKERAFSEYLREEVERVQQGKPGREVMNPQIHGMIDDAREKVMRGNLDEAVRMVAEVEVLVDRLQDASQKRLFYYDIRDLKTSIKLASLT